MENEAKQVHRRTASKVTAQIPANRWLRWTGFISLIVVITLWMTPGFAQEKEIVEAGKREFRHYCVLCHGLGGKGESVMTTFNLLKVTPPDLTKLSKRHKGQFPFWQVYRIIDGREEVKGHGTRDMPVWGEVFIQQENGRLVDESRAIGRILALVYYLRSIQEK
jgi:hypothetical protein